MLVKTFNNSKKSYIALMVFLLATIILGLFVAYRIFAADPTLRLTPSAVTIPSGSSESFTLEVRLNTNGQQVSAAEFSLSYDSSRLTLVNPATPIDVAGGQLPQLLKNKEDSIGIVSFAAGINPQQFVSGDLLIGKISFTPKTGSSGTAQINFSGSLKVLDNQINNIYQSSTGTSVTFEIPSNPPGITIASNCTLCPNNTDINLSSTVSADPNSGGIDRVEYFYSQGSNARVGIGVNSTAPYNFTWLKPNAGTYAVTADVYDKKGAKTTSNTLNIVVNAPSAPPTVGLNTNGTNFIAPATIVLTANATAATGKQISKVEFLNGASIINTDTQAPYSFNVNANSPATYNFKAVAYDNSSPPLVGNSQVIQVTVSQAPQPPDAPKNLRETSKTSVSIGISWDAPTAPATWYILTRNGTDLPAQITQTSFIDTGLEPNTSYRYSVKAVNANGTSPASNEINITTNPKPRLEGDVDNDGDVDRADLTALVGLWGSNNANADFNTSGKVDGFDFIILFKNFGRSA